MRNEHAEPGEIEVRECTTIDEFEACVVMQHEVFALPDIDIAPRPYLVALRRAGGWTLGAFDAGRLVGFVILMVAARSDHQDDEADQPPCVKRAERPTARATQRDEVGARRDVYVRQAEHFTLHQDARLELINSRAFAYFYPGMLCMFVPH